MKKLIFNKKTSILLLALMMIPALSMTFFVDESVKNLEFNLGLYVTFSLSMILIAVLLPVFYINGSLNKEDDEAKSLGMKMLKRHIPFMIGIAIISLIVIFLRNFKSEVGMGNAIIFGPFILVLSSLYSGIKVGSIKQGSMDRKAKVEMYPALLIFIKIYETGIIGFKEIKEEWELNAARYLGDFNLVQQHNRGPIFPTQRGFNLGDELKEIEISYDILEQYEKDLKEYQEKGTDTEFLDKNFREFRKLLLKVK